MKTVIFGATGMVGQGVLRACLLDPEVDSVLSVGRHATQVTSPKLREIVHADMLDLGLIEDSLSGFDACLFCLGISSVGLSESSYARVTYDMTLNVATVLARLNPAMTFVYLSAAGSDRTGQSRSMWARVRGRTENELFRLPFAHVFCVRPAVIRPMHGIRSRTRYVDLLYRMLNPVLPALQALLPAYVTSSEELARAMLTLARRDGTAHIFESRQIAGLALSPSGTTA